MVLTILMVLSKIQVLHCQCLLSLFHLFVNCFNVVVFPFLASVCLIITDEHEAFIRRVLKIPFEQRKCKDLITLDMLHAYCGGPEPTPAARRLNTYSRCCK